MKAAIPGSTRKRALPKGQPGPDCAKQCGCGTCFTRDDLLHLPSLTPIGMLHVTGEPAASSMYCFTHTRWSCRTTFGLPVETFRDQIREKIPEKCLAGTAACAGHCSKIEDLELCENECSLAPYRRFLVERLVHRK
ncbi:MAG TPA: hypothetical protein VIR81_08900 [Myxococcales bacterium]|nr:hypothetical protein [Myxococcales bacterium]